MTAFLAAMAALGLQGSTAPAKELIPKITQVIEVPMDFDGTAIFLKGTINGKPASFFFDTGFSGSLLVSDMINVGPKAGEINLIDFVGQHVAPTVKVNSVSLGKMQFKPKDLEIAQEPLFVTEAYGKHGDAILGFELFSPYVFELNFRDKKVVFYPSEQLDISKRKADNVNTFLVEMLPFGTDTVNLEVSYKGHKLALAYDTGNSFYLTTHKEFLKKFGAFAEDKPTFVKQSMVASGATDSFSWWAHDWFIGSVPIDHAVFDILDLPSSQIEHGGTIGIGFIQKFNTILDYRRRLVWMERVEPYKFEPPKAELGLVCAYDEKKERWRVYAIAKGSPAEKAGIKKGDFIFAVDGTDLRLMTRKQMEDLLDGVSGSMAKLTLSRGGNLIKMDIKREFLINGDPPPGL